MKYFSIIITLFIISGCQQIEPSKNEKKPINEEVQNTDLCNCIDKINKNDLPDLIEKRLEKCIKENVVDYDNIKLTSNLYNNCPNFWNLSNLIEMSSYIKRMDSINEANNKNKLIGKFIYISPPDSKEYIEINKTEINVFNGSDTIHKYKVRWNSKNNYTAFLNKNFYSQNLRKINDSVQVELIGILEDSLVIKSKENNFEVVYILIPKN